MLFQERKLAGLWRQAEKDANRARRLMDSYPLIFGPAQRSEVESAISRLDVARRGEKDPRILAAEVKQFRGTADRYLPLHRSFLVREYAEAIIIALCLALFIRTFIVQAFKIPSGSMIPTLLVGDHLIVNKFIYGFEIPFSDKKFLPLSKPKRGDIVVFRYPVDPTKDFIKRVVGLPGDRITVMSRNLYVNGREMRRVRDGSYEYFDTNGLKETGTLYTEDLDGVKHTILLSGGFEGGKEGEWVVPEGHYFCMGDNRDRSSDSRYWLYVDFNQIRGRAEVIYFSWPPRQFTRMFHRPR